MRKGILATAVALATVLAAAGPVQAGGSGVAADMDAISSTCNPDGTFSVVWEIENFGALPIDIESATLLLPDAPPVDAGEFDPQPVPAAPAISLLTTIIPFGLASATLEVDASTTGGSTTLVAEVELGGCTPVSTTSTSTSTTATTVDGAAAQPASAEAAATAPRFAG